MLPMTVKIDWHRLRDELPPEHVYILVYDEYTGSTVGLNAGTEIVCKGFDGAVCYPLILEKPQNIWWAEIVPPPEKE